MKHNNFQSEYNSIVKEISPFFNGDNKKIRLWMISKNPILGGISPKEMIAFGRYDKLYKLVIQALDENIMGL